MALIKCAECGHEISEQATTCPSCGHPNVPPKIPVEKPPSKTGPHPVILVLIAIIAIIVFVISLGATNNSSVTGTKKTVGYGHYTKSAYEHDITKATTSKGLSFADIAWHALNTYGYACEEVVSQGAYVGESQGGFIGTYYTVECSNGFPLRGYPRSGQHPKITDFNGY